TRADMRQRFPIGSAVWCLWDGGKEYSARIMKHDEKRGEFRYKVHFTGWNSRHDEWVAESQLRINKNPISESIGQGPVRYSPDPESSKKKNGKRRREDKNPSEERKERKEEKELIAMREKMDQKLSKRKIEILSDIPPPPMKRSKAARMKYSPPPKPVPPTSVRSRGRPPKNPSGAAVSYGMGPSTSGVNSSKYKSSRYDDENEATASTSNRLLSPSTVRRKKRENGGLEFGFDLLDGRRTPLSSFDTHPPSMGSPTSAMLSLSIDLYLDYGGRLRSPDGRTRRMLTQQNKKEVIASLVESIKKDERAIAEEKKRRTNLQWLRYLEFKKDFAKDFDKYLTPRENNRVNADPLEQQPAPAAAAA
ncbi:hypothetical protein PENTCL1PPCAC_17326, partial [Pristionchus entomophagus]